MTYEPYLSTVRSNPSAGKIIATTLDYPMIMDTFGCTPKFLADNPKAAKALADSYFDAIDLIAKEPKKSFEIMGADVKQSGEAFEKSQAVDPQLGTVFYETLLDENAMVDALCSGHLRHAGLDVFTVEPLPALAPPAGSRWTSNTSARLRLEPGTARQKRP